MAYKKTVPRDFFSDLENSKEDDPYLTSAYKQHFKFKTIRPATLEEQKHDKVDYIMVMPDGTTEAIEQKRRLKAYPDILLEMASILELLTFGWLFATKADHLAYYVEPIDTLILIRLNDLKKAWFEKGPAWLDRFPLKLARTRDDLHGNVRYHTLNIPIPINELKEAGCDVLEIKGIKDVKT